MNQSREMLQSIGIDVYDSFGKLRDVGSIVDELGASFSSLSSETQQMLGLQLAGRLIEAV